MVELQVLLLFFFQNFWRFIFPKHFRGEIFSPFRQAMNSKVEVIVNQVGWEV